MRGSQRGRLEELVRQLCREYGADEAVICAQIQHESGWDPNAVGDNGHSVGLEQLHDLGMGRGMGDSRYDPETNVRKALAAHIHHRDAFGSVEAALAAHNAGGGAVGAAYGAGGDWTTVVHHRKENGTIVYVKDIYVDPIMRTAEKYR